MSYNWERAPTPFERHRKGLIASVLILAIGAVLAWPML